MCAASPSGPDGSRIATGSFDGTAKVWDAQTGKEMIILAGHAGPVGWVTFSPDGSQLATTGLDDFASRIWEANTGNELFVLKGHQGGVVNAAFRPDGTRLATGADDGSAKI